MFLWNALYDVLRYIGTVFRNLGNDIPRPNIPLIGGLLDWLGDRIHGVGDTLYEIAYQIRDIADWFELVHDIVQYIIDFVDIEDWLKDLWGIPSLTIGWIGLKAIDVLHWMLVASEDFADDFIDWIKPALKRAFSLLDLTADGLRWVIENVVEDAFEYGSELMLRVIWGTWRKISEFGGVLEDWITDRGDWLVNDALHLPFWFLGQIIDASDWIINEGLRLGDWIRSEIDLASDWVTSLLDKAFWQMLDFMVNMPETFVTAVLDALSATYETFSDKIVDLGELILDHVWGEE